jgi:hypothetical protein
VACPLCHAAQGEQCTHRGHNRDAARLLWPHAGRTHAAVLAQAHGERDDVE